MANFYIKKNVIVVFSGILKNLSTYNMFGKKTYLLQQQNNY